jgi:hypothetical protein
MSKKVNNLSKLANSSGYDYVTQNFSPIIDENNKKLIIHNRILVKNVRSYYYAFSDVTSFIIYII